MKFLNQSLDSLSGRNIATHKSRQKRSLEQYFENPIIHRAIEGDRVYVPNINRVWNGI